MATDISCCCASCPLAQQALCFLVLIRSRKTTSIISRCAMTHTRALDESSQCIANIKPACKTAETLSKLPLQICLWTCPTGGKKSNQKGCRDESPAATPYDEQTGHRTLYRRAESVATASHVRQRESAGDSRPVVGRDVACANCAATTGIQQHAKEAAAPPRGAPQSALRLGCTWGAPSPAQ